MDPKSYCLVKTNRNLQYNVFHVKAKGCKPTLVFLHGFPNSSYDWRYQIKFFTDQGYGVVAPDLLGYGGTDKPLDTALYKASGIAQDVVDILDRIGVTGDAIPIGHDWGSKIVSRLANDHQDRFAAFGFLAVGYGAPNPTLSYKDFVASTAKVFGRELFGYWAFFSEDDAPAVVTKYYDAFWDGLFAFEPETVKLLAATGGFDAYLPKNLSVPLPAFLPPAVCLPNNSCIDQTGLSAPFNWYKVVTSDLDREDAALVPKENYKINKPVFYGAALNDMVAVSALFYATMPPYVPQLTIQNYTASHWVQWEKRDEVNQDINAWVGTLGLAACAAKFARFI
ncbi:alpha/beta-hydrolase [Crepidotus variabilis]|uniref:Alpha/beta-hydrolase n=1 Tax=Crepidotus variabilis TaxID=179855 RepID=A0A9P6E392_9AGAR|nr:alpha/beta-hydrolase [Crepidotus variabilis]